VLLVCVTIKVTESTPLTSKIIAYVVDTLLELLFPQFYEKENVAENIISFTEAFIESINTACVLTTGIYFIQMLLSIKNHQKTVLNAYSGKCLSLNFY